MMLKNALLRTDVRVPDNYSIIVTGSGDILIAFALNQADDIVAGGRIAISEDVAVFDQIWTHEEHRRRRLASAVMGTLENAALLRNATRGMLVATEAGSALYRTLGWDAYAPYTTAIADQA